MMKRFQDIKHDFVGRVDPDVEPKPEIIDLPEGIGEQDSEENNIRNGQLHITCGDMEEMFEGPVTTTIHLIEQQLAQIKSQGLRASTIFLSGGFSRNEYLYNCVNNLARSRRFHLHRGFDPRGVVDPRHGFDSWTAVAKGAVLMGLGVDCDIPPECIQCPYHIGVVLSPRFAQYEHREVQRYTDTFDGSERARDTIQWVVARGDLVEADKAIEKKLRIVRKMTSSGNQVGTVTVLTSAFDGKGEPPRLYAKQGAHHVVNLDYDLSRIPREEQKRLWRNDTTPQGTAFYRVEMQLEICVSQVHTRVDLLCGKREDAQGSAVDMGGGFSLASKTIPLHSA